MSHLMETNGYEELIRAGKNNDLLTAKFYAGDKMVVIKLSINGIQQGEEVSVPKELGLRIYESYFRYGYRAVTVN